MCTTRHKGGFAECPPCSAELSPIWPLLNICCGNNAGAGGGLPTPIQYEEVNIRLTDRSDDA